MKIYASQVPPEYQESPLMLDESFFPDDVILDGNRDYRSHTTPAYDRIIEYMDDAQEALDDLENYPDDAYYKDATEAINAIFPRDDGKRYSTRQIHAWKAIITEWDQDDDQVCDALELITGNAYVSTTIRGCCQSDWQDAFFPASWGRGSIEELEAEYFNTGSEWAVCETDDDIQDVSDLDDQDLVYMYTTSWNDDDTKKEIADAFNGTANDVTLFPFSGFSRVASWNAAV